MVAMRTCGGGGKKAYGFWGQGERRMGLDVIRILATCSVLDAEVVDVKMCLMFQLLYKLSATHKLML